jgi:hypothetical protein
MLLLRFLPRPASWASGLALFAFARVVGIGMALALPILFELMRLSPRLAWVGILGVWLAPVMLATIAHRVTSATLDVVDAERARPAPNHAAASLRAGLFAWLAVIFTSTVATLALLVIDPPPVEPDTLGAFFATAAGAGKTLASALIWIVVASLVYEVDARAMRGEARDS